MVPGYMLIHLFPHQSIFSGPLNLVSFQKSENSYIPPFWEGGGQKFYEGCGWCQGVKSGVRDVPGGKGSPRDPRGSREASGVYQRGPWSAKDIPGGQGGLQGCQGVKGDVRGIQVGGSGESRGSKVLRGKSGVYHGV